MAFRLRARFFVGLTVLLSTFATVVVLVFWNNAQDAFRGMLASSQSTASMALLDEDIRQSKGFVRLIAKQLANPLYFNEFDTVAAFARTALDQPGVLYIHIFDDTNHVIHDGTDALESFGMKLDDAQIHKALETMAPVSSIQGNILQTTVPIFVGSKYLGGVRIGSDLSPLQDASNLLQRNLSKIADDSAATLGQSIAGITLGLAVAGIIVGFLIFSGVTSSIIAMTKSLRAIGHGRYEVGFSNTIIHRTDEVGELARSVKEMALSLSASDAKLREALKVAQSANEAKTKFLSSMSHELRTPLNAVLGFSQLLESDTNGLSPDQRKAVDYIIKGGEYLTELVDDVLNLARIEAGEIELKIVPTAPGKIIRQCVSMTEALAANAGVSVAVSSDLNAVPALQVDGKRFKQIYLNLLSNAVKYNKPGGSVTLSFERQDDAMLRLRITDTGIGIPAEKAAHLFTPFERLGHEASSIEGTGIGLSITKQLIELMAGRIGYESEAGYGSTFWVDVPLAAEAGDVSSPPSSDAPAIATNTTAMKQAFSVLVVEDNADNIALLSNILGRMDNVSVQIAVTAEAGLEIAESAPPDVILMDIHLPDIDGIEALKRLKQNTETANIPVLALSADALPEKIDAAMKAGFTDYITKPFKLAALTAVLEKHL